MKKEIGTAKVVLREILLRYRLSGNSHPSSAGNLTFIRLGVINARILSYELSG